MNTIPNFIKSIGGRIKRRLKPAQKQISQKDVLMQGYRNFLKTGQTTTEVLIAMINTYCDTNGRLFEELQDRMKTINPPKRMDETLEGCPGVFSSIAFNSINKELNDKGYIIFDKKLSKELCTRLTEFALKEPASIPGRHDKIRYESGNPQAEIYRFDIQALVNNTDIQNLMMDPVLVHIARNYLGCEPIFDFPAMWWSTSFQKEASSEAAQLYHFDLDRVKWLKIFFYINDVTEDNGPHRYIEGSHRSGAKPDVLLKRGYARIKDEDMYPHYPVSAMKVVCGEAGSIFAGDTKCWHKGTNLKNGHRLVLELEYTSSLFGANIPKMQIQNYSKEFREYCHSNKVFAANLSFDEA